MTILPYLNYIALFSIIVIILALVSFFKIHEAFASQEDVGNINLITSLMTIISESLCPSTLFAIQTVLDKSKWVPQKDTEYGDKTYKTLDKKSFDECSAACALEADCKGFVYKAKNRCELKKSMDAPMLKEPTQSSPFKGMPTDPDPANASRTYGISAKRPELIMKGSDAQKRKQALEIITKEANGTLFTCPVDSDPYRIPANIAQRIQISVAYLEPMVTKALKNITDALNCSPDVMKTMADDKTKADGLKNQSKLSSLQGTTIDGFFNFDPETSVLCSREYEAILDREVEEAAKKSSTKKCIRQSKLSDEDKTRILQMRVVALVSVVSNQALVKSLMTIKKSFEMLAELKAKALKGELVPTCVSSMSDEYTGSPTSQATKDEAAKLQELGKKLGSSKSLDDRMLGPILGMVGLLRSMG
jgi:hypothetical protein